MNRELLQAFNSNEQLSIKDYHTEIDEDRYCISLYFYTGVLLALKPIEGLERRAWLDREDKKDGTPMPQRKILYNNRDKWSEQMKPFFKYYEDSDVILEPINGLGI